MAIENIVNSLPDNSGVIPPVHKWNPPLSGDMPIVIDNRGRWFHDGEPIKRQSLVNLFASILKREGDDYFLVTPSEKWRIDVALVPLLIVNAEVLSPGRDDQQVIVTTQQGQRITVGNAHPLSMAQCATELIPTVLVRHNLSAIVERNVFYQLADYAEIHTDSELIHQERYVLRSQGIAFTL